MSYLNKSILGSLILGLVILLSGCDSSETEASSPSPSGEENIKAEIPDYELQFLARELNYQSSRDAQLRLFVLRVGILSARAGKHAARVQKRAAEALAYQCPTTESETCVFSFEKNSI